MKFLNKDIGMWLLRTNVHALSYSIIQNDNSKYCTMLFNRKVCCRVKIVIIIVEVTMYCHECYVMKLTSVLGGLRLTS